MIREMSASKRSLDEDDEARKRARLEAETANSVVVYQPNVVIPDLAKKMNSLVQVRRAERRRLRECWKGSGGGRGARVRGVVSQVLIPAKYLNGETRQVKLRQLWGEAHALNCAALIQVLHAAHAICMMLVVTETK